MAGVVGIEPTSMVLETTVLPLYYTPISAVANKIINYVLFDLQETYQLFLQNLL